MRIEIDDNSAALTPFGSLVSAAVRSKTAGKPWPIAFHADHSDRQSSTNMLPAALLTIAIVAIISIGFAKDPLGTTYLGQSNATSSYGTSHSLPLTLFDHR
jgi:hypothetical protein